MGDNKGVIRAVIEGVGREKTKGEKMIQENREVVLGKRKGCKVRQRMDRMDKRGRRGKV